MSVYDLHFARVTDLIAVERRLLRALSRDATLLPVPYQHLYRYAVNLARMGWLRTPSGQDVDLGEELAPYRRWLRDHLLRLVPRHFMPDAAGLLALAPLVAIRTHAMRQALLERHVGEFDAHTLDGELRQKVLALVLGGGGGSGLAHLGLLQLLHELDVEPSYIVGSSMGSLVGLIRALQRRYDPVQALHALPKRLDLRQIFKPFSGFSRFGFPGAIDLHLLPMTQAIFRDMLGRAVPRFSELAIRLEVVTAGVRRGWQVDAELEAAYSQASRQGSASSGMRQKLQLFFRTVRQLANNPRFISQLVFNDEPGTEDMSVAAAIGFSCSVPGLLHFDLFDEDPHLTGSLDRIFARHRLFRLTDGGVVNNVPSRVAWRSIQRGKLGTRNAFIYAVDPFAPIATNRNAIFLPIQRVARPGVLANRPYSDYTRTVRAAPSPLNLAPSYRQLKGIVTRARGEFDEDADFIRNMMQPIDAFERWSSALSLSGASLQR